MTICLILARFINALYPCSYAHISRSNRTCATASMMQILPPEVLDELTQVRYTQVELCWEIRYSRQNYPGRLDVLRRIVLES